MMLCWKEAHWRIQDLIVHSVMKWEETCRQSQREHYSSFAKLHYGRVRWWVRSLQIHGYGAQDVVCKRTPHFSTSHLSHSFRVKGQNLLLPFGLILFGGRRKKKVWWPALYVMCESRVWTNTVRSSSVRLCSVKCLSLDFIFNAWGTLNKGDLELGFGSDVVNDRNCALWKM